MAYPAISFHPPRNRIMRTLLIPMPIFFLIYPLLIGIKLSKASEALSNNFTTGAIFFYFSGNLKTYRSIILTKPVKDNVEAMPAWREEHLHGGVSVRRRAHLQTLCGASLLGRSDARLLQ